MSRELARVLTLKDATMIVVSSIIGVGIFLTPGEVARLIPNASLFLGAWILGGALSLAGALANAELGAMFPKAGGNYVYLREAIHPLAGFVVGWQSFFAIFVGTVATLGTGVATSLSSFFVFSEREQTLIAVAAIVLISLVNIASTRMSANLNTVTGFLKVAALVALAAFGLFASPLKEVAKESAEGATTLVSFGSALSPVLFSYLGWNASVFVGGEIRDPQRNIPRSLFLGLAISTLAYLVLAFVYVRVLGIGGLARSENAGADVAGVIFGARGASLFGALVALSILGCLSANVLTGPRILYAMAKDGLFFRAVSTVGEKSAAPTPAIIIQGAFAIALVLFARDLGRVLNYTTFAIVLATIADTLALYLLRRKLPNAERPYRAHGYPFVPLLYVAANVAIAIAMLMSDPKECVLGLAVAALGVPAYFLFRRSSAFGKERS